MKYFCIADAIPALKTSYSDNFFQNLPIIGTPIFGWLPIGKKEMESAFANSTTLILCKTFEDAALLREIKLKTYEFYMQKEYAIYEIESDAELTFSMLNEAAESDLKIVVSDELYTDARFKENGRDKIPPIQICLTTKEQLKPTLLKCHKLEPVHFEINFNENETTKAGIK